MTAADLDGQAMQRLRAPAEISMNLGAELWILQEGKAILGGKDRVQDDAGERLRHRREHDASRTVDATASRFARLAQETQGFANLGLEDETPLALVAPKLTTPDCEILALPPFGLPIDPAALNANGVPSPSPGFGEPWVSVRRAQRQRRCVIHRAVIRQRDSILLKNPRPRGQVRKQ